MEPAAAHEIAPLKAGDGVVFDAADWRSPQEDEEGGRVYQVSPQLDGTLELSFANNAVNFRRIRAGRSGVAHARPGTGSGSTSIP